MSRKVLGIDPGEHAGVALLVDGKLQWYRAANGSKFVTLRDAIREDLTGAECVIEDGWLARIGAKGALTLGRRRGLAQAAAESWGVDARRVHFIHSSTWQNTLFGSHKARGGQDTKDLSLQFVRDTYAVTPDSHDIADAICLAHYWSKNG